MPQGKVTRRCCCATENDWHDVGCPNNKLPMRECEWCGERFKPLHPDMKHCSQQCHYYENGPGEWFPPAGS